MFRQSPPEDLVLMILRHVGLSGWQDHRWFSKDDLRLEGLDEWLPLLEPYYLPCKSKRYLHGELDKNRLITVLRHLCQVHNVEMKAQERVMKGKKTTLYQIFAAQKDTVITFD